MCALVDTHIHLSDDLYVTQIDDVLKKMKNHGIKTGIIPGYSINACRTILKIHKSDPSIPVALGLHPLFLESSEANLKELPEMCNLIKLTAIGEIGMDKRQNAPSQFVQEEAFRFQLGIADELKLPVIIHCVGYHEKCVDLLKSFLLSSTRTTGMAGVIHRISCSREIARKYLDLGFYCGLGPDLLDSGRSRLHELAKWLPLDRIVLETDAPYSKKPDGTLFQPWQLSEVLVALATLRKESVTNLQTIIALNTLNLFGAI